MEKTAEKLAWSEEFSVHVKLLDEQHKVMVSVINELIDCVNNGVEQAKIDEVIARLTNYKHHHFATEEKYFVEFNFEGAAEHVEAHRHFNEKIEGMKKQYANDALAFTFNLLDFLEDWLINHIQTMDHKYVKCFNEHGLK